VNRHLGRIALLLRGHLFTKQKVKSPAGSPPLPHLRACPPPELSRHEMKLHYHAEARYDLRSRCSHERALGRRGTLEVCIHKKLDIKDARSLYYIFCSVSRGHPRLRPFLGLAGPLTLTLNSKRSALDQARLLLLGWQADYTLPFLPCCPALCLFEYFPRIALPPAATSPVLSVGPPPSPAAKETS